MKTQLVIIGAISLLTAGHAFCQTKLAPPDLALGSVSVPAPPPISPEAAQLELASARPAPARIPDSTFTLGALPFRPVAPPALPHSFALKTPGAAEGSAVISEKENHLFALMDEDRALRHSIATEGPLDHALRRTFEPEVIHFHHAAFACSIVTAIKRKNPFCLLNPQFLQLSW